jgi:hypothetical protein
VYRRPQQKPVEHGGQLLAGVRARPLVAGGHAQLQGHRGAHPVPAVDGALVQHLQQAVEDGRTALEEFVQEGELGLRQPAGGDADEPVRLEGGQADRPDHHLRGGEPGEQQAELGAAGPGDQEVEQQGLAAPGRPDEQQVLAGHEGGQGQVDLVVAFDQDLGQLAADGGQPVPDGVGVGGRRFIRGGRSSFMRGLRGMGLDAGLASATPKRRRPPPPKRGGAAVRDRRGHARPQLNLTPIGRRLRTGHEHADPRRGRCRTAGQAVAMPSLAARVRW